MLQTLAGVGRRNVFPKTRILALRSASSASYPALSRDRGLCTPGASSGYTQEQTTQHSSASQAVVSLVLHGDRHPPHPL